jgi:hypothetical protein
MNFRVCPSLMDDLIYNEKGNEVMLIKYLHHK